MTSGSRRAVAAVLIVGMLGSLVVAGLAGLFASRDPDGLQRVAQEQGFAAEEESSATAEGPLAGYSVDGVQDEGLATSVSGVAGVGLTMVLGMGLFWFLSRKPEAGAEPDGPVAGLDVGFGSPDGEELSSEPHPGDDPWPDRG